MSKKKVWLVVVLILVCMCALGTTCATLGYLGYRSIEQGDVLSARQEEPLVEDDRQSASAGGTLWLLGAFPPTLDPAMVQDSTSAEYVVHLFSGLVSLNDKLEVIPDLASDWEVSDDGRSYLFHLLAEATFQNGRPITADDFVYSIERACSPELASPVAASYLSDIVGVPEFVAGRAEHIEGLVSVSDHELQIEIDAPKAYFLAKLTYPTAFVVDRVQIEEEGEGWQRRPNGSGPFVLEELGREGIVLARNERYYGARAALERVEYLLSGGSPVTMYENDELDLVEVPPSEIERVTDPTNPLHAEHDLALELSVFYLGLNAKVAPFDDIAVRQAFAHAIDKEKLADLVLKGTATVANGILPPAMPDYDQDLEGLSYDPALARRLLASSRYAGENAMPKIVLSVSGSSGHMSSLTKAILTMIEDNLDIEMMVEQVVWEHFLRDLNEERYQMFSAGWIADYPDSQNFLDILFHSESSQNHTGYHNEQVDNLLERARVESDPSRRTELYREAERIIVAEVAWVPLTHATVHTLVKPYVRGFRTSSAIYPWLKDIHLEE